MNNAWCSPKFLQHGLLNSLSQQQKNEKAFHFTLRSSIRCSKSDWISLCHGSNPRIIPKKKSKTINSSRVELMNIHPIYSISMHFLIWLRGWGY